MARQNSEGVVARGWKSLFCLDFLFTFSSMEKVTLKFVGVTPDFQANPLRPLVLSTLKTIFFNVAESGPVYACIKVLIVDAKSVASVAACQKGS